jgi:hypothetical protein
MCVVRERQLSSEDLAVLSGQRFVDYEPSDECAAEPDLVIREKPGFQLGLVCLSQIIRAARFQPAGMT